MSAENGSHRKEKAMVMVCSIINSHVIQRILCCDYIKTDIGR